MAFPQFQFHRAAAKLNTATETTIRKIQRMREIRMNLSIHKSHELPGVTRGRLMTRQMIHRLKRETIRKNPLSHETRLNLRNRRTQKNDALFVNHTTRGIQSIHSRQSIRKSQSIHQSYHAIHKIHWSDDGQLQTNLQKQSFQPKHPNKPNEPIS